MPGRPRPLRHHAVSGYLAADQPVRKREEKLPVRMSMLFGRTLREAPSGVEVASHGLLLRAGFIRQLAAGIFSYLPLAKRSIGKIEDILREEMDAADGQEVSMPVVQPADVWERSAGTIRRARSWYGSATAGTGRWSWR